MPCVPGIQGLAEPQERASVLPSGLDALGDIELRLLADGLPPRASCGMVQAAKEQLRNELRVLNNAITIGIETFKELCHIARLDGRTRC